MTTAKRARMAAWICGEGVEIGALNRPLEVPPGVRVRYVDRLTVEEQRRHYPELSGDDLAPVDIIGSADDLAMLGSESQDFIIANHLMEHVVDPIGALAEMTRVLKAGGILYLALPDPRVTFDRDRDYTTLDHVLDDHRDDAALRLRDHYVDWVHNVELPGHVPHIDPAQQSDGPGLIEDRIQKLMRDAYSIHLHVWRPDDFLQVVHAAKATAGLPLEPVAFAACEAGVDDEYLLIYRKGDAAPPPPLRTLKPEVVAEMTQPRGHHHATRVELGCGAHKREGFFGIDIAPGPQTDLVLDIEREPFPFEDDTVEHIYSSHTFEHLVAPGSPIQTLREIMRVMKHGGIVEIWTPHGRSDDGLLFGHGVFYTETHWKHICFMYDDFYLGEGTRGRFKWLKTQYVLFPGIIDRLESIHVPLDLALDHMHNVALEFGVFLQVDKTRSKSESPQVPIAELCYRRGEVITRVPSGQRRVTASMRQRIRRRVAASRAAPAIRKVRAMGRRIRRR